MRATSTAMERAYGMGARRSPDGVELAWDRHSLLRDGKPWVPVMGEFHYARCPAGEWRDEFLKMRMGGIGIVASYVFWIHHEEIEGEFDWSGERSLRHFVETAGDSGLQVVVRCGPWCHGEVRNGGLPDWVAQGPWKSRSNDPGYLAKVRILYGEIAAQLRGLLWKEGGPVVGIQVENEFDGPAEHLLELKRIACEAGIDVPYYTRTSWPQLTTPMPFGELLPLYGGYAEGFWDRELVSMPQQYKANFIFSPIRTDTAIATDWLGKRPPGDDDEAARYPYLMCELGGGMVSSYHRRILIASEDIEAMSLVKLGSGNVLPGYYMFHGGINPEGKRTTLQESQATHYWNDLPVKNYDLQAPLGAFGQMRPHYHFLRRLHLFLGDYGTLLARMPAWFPEQRRKSGDEPGTLRWAVRSDGASGFLFVNNHQRSTTMPAHEEVQFDLKLADGSMRLPSTLVGIAPGSRFIWPFNLDLGGIVLAHATAQLVCRIEAEGVAYTIFSQTEGIAAEFVMKADGAAVEMSKGDVHAEGEQIQVRNVPVGMDAAIRLRSREGRIHVIVLLDEGTSRGLWKETWHGCERLFLTTAGVIVDGAALRLQAGKPKEFAVSMLPAVEALSDGSHTLIGAPAGVFRRFAPTVAPLAPVAVTWECVQPVGEPRKIALGSQGVAEAPGDADFEAAAVWRVRFRGVVDGRRNLRLRINYIGDVARLYIGGVLALDDFYNGDMLEIGLARHADRIAESEVLLKILPLQKGAPVFMAEVAARRLGDASSRAEVVGIEVCETRELRLTAR